MNLSKIIAAFCLSVCISTAMAGTVKVPANKPLVTINIPDTWEPEETDKGVACESPDNVATVFFEVAASEKSMNALLDENIDWLVEEQGVKIKGESKHESEIMVGGIKSSLMGFDASSKEFGPAKVGFIFTPIGKKVLVTTYWISVKGFEKHDPTLTKILASVKAAK